MTHHAHHIPPFLRYLCAMRRIVEWCTSHGLHQLVDVQSFHADMTRRSLRRKSSNKPFLCPLEGVSQQFLTKDVRFGLRNRTVWLK